MVDETPADDVPVVEPPTEHETLVQMVRATLVDESEADLHSETERER